MPHDDTQPALCLQQPLLLAQLQPTLYGSYMNYGQRLKHAMRLGGFPTDASLASALTKHLQAQGRLKPDHVVPEQTIQSARTRIVKNGMLSRYTLDFAKLCRVSPYWLAYGEGEPQSIAPGGKPVDEFMNELMAIWPTLGDKEKAKVVGFAASQGEKKEIGAKLNTQKQNSPRRARNL